MSQALSAAAFETFATLLKNRSGLVIGPDKLYLLETRLAPILKREQLRDLTALAEKLRSPANEAVIKQVVEAMTTNESFFFRDDKPFVHFRNQALPQAAGGARRRCTVAHMVGRIVVGTGSLLDRDDPDGMPRQCRQPQDRDHRHRPGTRNTEPRPRGAVYTVRGTAWTAGADADAVLPQGREQLADQRRHPQHGAVP